jgi:serine/threonine protein kinase
MIGTVDYLAPEQAIDSHKVDERADIYSLGCTLYFMLKGDAPFPQGTIPQRLMQHQTAEPAAIRDTRPDAPEELIAICRKMMAKAAADRYQNADEVVQAISEWLGDGVAPAADLGEMLNGPPPGPSQNEDLTLMPLDDEPDRRGAAKPSDSKASGIGSKSGVKAAGSSGIKTGPSASNALEGVSVDPTGSKPRSGVKSGARPLSEVPKPDPLVDELMAASALPPTEHLRSPPLSTATRMHSEEFSSPIWMIVGISVLGAGLIVGAIIALIVYTGI